MVARRDYGGPVQRTSPPGDRPATREWRPGWPSHPGHVDRALFGHRHGGGDPTFRRDAAGRSWLGRRTPEGPATLVIEERAREGSVRAGAWGPGATWLLDRVPDLVGAADDPAGFEPRHPVLVEAHRRHPHLRMGRSGLVMEALVPAIIEQKVTGQEAFAGFRRLVHRYGERAPGPGARVGLWLQPTPEALARVPSWEWLAMHVDPQRSRTVARAAKVAASLERAAGRGADELDRCLQSVPGVGEWTSAEVRQKALGDPDAVSFGDYHVAKDVGWALTGEPFDDEQMRAYLEPWRPHRGRVVRLLGAAGLHRPRRGPRMAPRTHLPVR